MNKILAGALAGTIATVPMTATMAAARAVLPGAARDPLPPRQITEHALDAAAEATGAATGVATPAAGDLSERGRETATTLAHYAFGAGAGALYGLVAAAAPAAPPVVRGVVWGITVWAGSYLGWLPALRLLPPATKDSPQRAVIMVAAHVVWGGTLGALTHRLSQNAPGNNP